MFENKFSSEEAQLLMQRYSSKGRFISHTTFAETFCESLLDDSCKLPAARDFFSKNLKGKKLIDLGPGQYGYTPLINLCDKLGVKEYVGVDPTYTPDWCANTNNLLLARENASTTARLVAGDGLSFLLAEKSSSAVVCSFGLFDLGAIEETASSLPGKLEERYIKELIKQIYRVTYQKGLTFHKILEGRHKDFETAGFEPLFRNFYTWQEKQPGHKEPKKICCYVT